MNETSRRLMELAAQVSPAYAANPAVRAIFVTGSVPLGFADDRSDVDLFVFYDRVPTEAEAEQSRQRANGTHLLYSPSEIFGEILGEVVLVSGVKFEIKHLLFARCERAIGDTVERADIDFSKQKLLTAILCSRALYGEPFIEKWRRLAATYPEELARKMVATHLDFKPFWFMAKYAIERNDLLVFYSALIELEKRLIAVGCGINRTYYRGSVKNSRGTIMEMRLKPDNMEERMRRVLREEPSAALVQIGGLVEEIFELVDAHLPEVRTAPHRFTMDV